MQSIQTFLKQSTIVYQTLILQALHIRNVEIWELKIEFQFKEMFQSNQRWHIESHPIRKWSCITSAHNELHFQTHTQNDKTQGDVVMKHEVKLIFWWKSELIKINLQRFKNLVVHWVIGYVHWSRNFVSLGFAKLHVVHYTH